MSKKTKMTDREIAKIHRNRPVFTSFYRFVDTIFPEFKLRLDIYHHGSPIPKARHRMAVVDGRARAFDRQHSESYLFITSIQKQIENNIDKPLSGPLILFWDFVYLRPKGHYGTGGNAGRLKPSAPVHRITKPDTSNLVKFPEDILNERAWNDDNQIILSCEHKRFADDDEQPHTRIVIFNQKQGEKA